MFQFLFTFFPVATLWLCRSLSPVKRQFLPFVAVDNLQVSVLMTSRAFGCEDYHHPVVRVRNHSFIVRNSYIGHGPFGTKLIYAPPQNAICHLQSIIWLGVLSLTQQFAWGITRSLCISMFIPGGNFQYALHREAGYVPTSRSFGGEDYLSPSNSRGESLVHCAILIYRACSHQSTIIPHLRPAENCDRDRQDSIVLHGRHLTRGWLFRVTMPQRINHFAPTGMILPSTLNKCETTFAVKYQVQNM